ncbi:MAG TPA: RNA-guided endonuclease TnpB family protein, partial [Chloroflexota bacterium]|nr:RNA-guided endonuclease TnpB family protein [Chloroflexota bacterium]
QQAIKNLGQAFTRFFKKEARYPKFKKKGRHESFRADNGPGTFRCEGKRIKLPILGWVRMREALRFAGRPLSVTISREADRWFASVAVQIDHSVPVRENQAAVVVDLGVTALATLSDGTVVEGPKALRGHLKQLRQLSRSVARKVKGSANRRKAGRKLARLHARIAHVRADALHKLTCDLVRRFTLLGIEDLHVRGMLANHRLARAVADVGMGEFRRQLTYKAALAGTRLVVVDRFFPSSKTCSACGAKFADLPLAVRAWTCPACGAAHDRDVNAAINVRNLAVSSTVLACGETGSGRCLATVKPVLVKQEPVAVYASV